MREYSLHIYLLTAFVAVAQVCATTAQAAGCVDGRGGAKAFARLAARSHNIPSVYELSLVPKEYAPRRVRLNFGPSPGSVDPDIEAARAAGAFGDFKPLSDYEPRISAPTRVEAERMAREIAAKAKRDAVRNGADGEEARSG